jgi:hypothetical protein
LPEVIKIGCIYHSPSGKFAKGGEDRWVFLDFPYGDGSNPWYLVNPKIAGKWMFIPLKMVSIGIDPYPHQSHDVP